MKSSASILLAILLIANAAFAAPLTNADVVKMSDAKLDESIIVTAVESSPNEFDTSPTALIALSEAKVSQAVIAAMIKRVGARENGSAAAPATAGPAETMSPSEVFIVEGDKVRPMRYINPQVRTAARGLGFGGVASYAVLRGVKANDRTTNAQPSFLVSVPNQAQAESYLTIASFAVRPNKSREVLIGGGFMSYSSGIHPDRIVAVNSEKAGDQSKAQKGFTIYRVTPKEALAPGEYAVILYTGELHGLVAAWFTGTGNSYFDFGVDS